MKVDQAHCHGLLSTPGLSLVVLRFPLFKVDKIHDLHDRRAVNDNNEYIRSCSERIGIYLSPFAEQQPTESPCVKWSAGSSLAVTFAAVLLAPWTVLSLGSFEVIIGRVRASQSVGLCGVLLRCWR